MSCIHKEKLKDFLEENLSPQEMQIIENHIEECSSCQQELDKLLKDPLPLPKNTEDIEDEVLIAKIKARRKGIIRITFYGILGFLLGIFSHCYTRDDFLLTKAIMALPYKLGEFALNVFFAGNKISPWHYHTFIIGGPEIFPFNPPLDYLAGIITPAIIASFMAITVGYLLSDKRVFRRKKIINFLAAGFLIFLIWIGVLYGGYAYTLSNIENLQNIKEITIYSVDKDSSAWLIDLDEEAMSEPKYRNLLQSISSSPTTMEPYSPEKTNVELILKLPLGGRITGFVDLESGNMHLINGKCYKLPTPAREQLETLVRRSQVQ